ncbi:MAG: hypothetical protein AAFP03_18190, partial [Cyanobacteria bacterium J06598_3]
LSLTVEKDTSSYDTTLQSSITPAQTLQAIKSAGAGTSIILDFDETLFLRNSTEAYLNSVYPRSLGAATLVAFKAIKPWRWFPARFKDESISRDWFLVVAMTLLFPWTLLLWPWRAKKLAHSYANLPLIQAIEANVQAQVVVATLGFAPIVRPLLRHFPIASVEQGRAQLIACGFFKGMGDRAKGKLAMVCEVLGQSVVTSAVVVTDSIKDEPLLSAAATPCLLKWPDAQFVPAMNDVYVPLFYSEKVKNPNSNHVVKRVLMGHWAFLVIALSFLSPHPIVHALSLLLLTISYWCVYEIGYQENDLIGEKYERNPILSETYARYKSRINLTGSPFPWYSAMGFAIPALLLLEFSQRSWPLAQSWAAMGDLWPNVLFNGVIWLALLVSVRLTFWVYNQFNEEARIWIYPILQIQKLFGFTLLSATNVVGALLLLSLLVCRWLHYSIYRCGGDRWRFPTNLSCLVLFSLMFGAISLSTPEPLILLTWQSGVSLGYCLLRSMKGWHTLHPRFELLIQSSGNQGRTANGIKRKEILLLPPDNAGH